MTKESTESTGTEATGATETAEATADESNALGTDGGIYTEPATESDATESTEDTTEGQEGDQTETDKPEGQNGGEADVVPETYEFTLPDGVELDEAAATAFGELGRELQLTQANADKLLPFYIEQMQAAHQSGADALVAMVDAESQTWREESLSAPDIGKDGIELARTAIEQFGGDGLKELREALTVTGLGNKNVFIRFCMRVAKACASDTLATGEGGGAKPSSETIAEHGIYA